MKILLTMVIALAFIYAAIRIVADLMDYIESKTNANSAQVIVLYAALLSSLMVIAIALCIIVMAAIWV